MAPIFTRGSKASAWGPKAMARISPPCWSSRSKVKNLPATQRADSKVREEEDLRRILQELGSKGAANGIVLYCRVQQWGMASSPTPDLLRRLIADVALLPARSQGGFLIEEVAGYETQRCTAEAPCWLHANIELQLVESEKPPYKLAIRRVRSQPHPRARRCKPVTHCILDLGPESPIFCCSEAVQHDSWAPGLQRRDINPRSARP